MCVCVRVRACACVCVCVGAYVHACVCVYSFSCPTLQTDKAVTVIMTLFTNGENKNTTATTFSESKTLGLLCIDEGEKKEQTSCNTEAYSHSEHRFPTPSSKKEGCRKPVLGVSCPRYVPRQMQQSVLELLRLRFYFSNIKPSHHRFIAGLLSQCTLAVCCLLRSSELLSNVAYSPPK